MDVGFWPGLTGGGEGDVCREAAGGVLCAFFVLSLLSLSRTLLPWHARSTNPHPHLAGVDDDTLGDVFLIYARTSAKGISLFLVEKGMEGFTLGSRIKDKLGMRASATAELSFQDVRVPRANLVGDLDKAVLCMMRNLEIERVGLGAMATGIARRCVEVMNAYGTEREAFGKPIREFGQIQRHIAESFASYAAGRCYLYTTSNGLALDASGNRLHTDGVKLFCTTMAKQVADNAIQVLGGNGYTGEYQVEQLWRDSKLLEIGGGTLESHHKNMVRDLAAMDKLE